MIKKRRNLKIICLISLVLIFTSYSLSFLRFNSEGEDYSSTLSPVTAQGDVHWPGNSSEWTEIDPADQGLDADKISQMFDVIESSSYDVHSVIIVKNGYLIREEFLNDSKIRPEKTYADGTKLHFQASTTKSLMSLLIGAAIGQGFLDNISQTLYEFFADIWDPSFSDSEQKKNITIEQLLTMNAGFIGSFNPSYPGSSTASLDCIEWALDDVPLIFTPGESGGFAYSNDGPNLLSGIISNVTGQSASTFAHQYLFEPMGITVEDWDWFEDNNHVSYGGYGFDCSPQVQAKLGILCLNKGNWNGTQLVPSEWVKDVTTYKVDGRWLYSPPSKYFNYGYLFYTNVSYNEGSDTGYHTSGMGGQSIFVIPEHNIVVAFTGWVSGAYDLIYRNLISKYVLQFWEGSAIDGIPFLVLMSILIFATAYYSLTIRKRIINS